MIVDVRWSSDETRHVYSPASSSETSDTIRLHVQAYLNYIDISFNIKPPLLIDRFACYFFSLVTKQTLSRTCVREQIDFDLRCCCPLPINVRWVQRIQPRIDNKQHFPWWENIQRSSLISHSFFRCFSFEQHWQMTRTNILTYLFIWQTFR